MKKLDYALAALSVSLCVLGLATASLAWLWSSSVRADVEATTTDAAASLAEVGDALGVVGGDVDESFELLPDMSTALTESADVLGGYAELLRRIGDVTTQLADTTDSAAGDLTMMSERLRPLIGRDNTLGQTAEKLRGSSTSLGEFGVAVGPVSQELDEASLAINNLAGAIERFHGQLAPSSATIGVAEQRVSALSEGLNPEATSAAFGRVTGILGWVVFYLALCMGALAIASITRIRTS